MSDNYDFENLQLCTFKKFSEKISAIAYHGDKIAVALASSYQRIEVWNYKSNKRELSINTHGLVSRYLKFDDSIIMSMFEEIQSWELPSGKHDSVYKGGVFRCCSFDYCAEFNIVVGSFTDSSIYIWNMSTGEEVKRIAQEHCTVKKVAVYPVLVNTRHRRDNVYLLVLKEREIEMWTLRFDPGDMREKNVMAHKVNSVHPFYDPFRKAADSKLECFRFKNEFLYYIESSDGTYDEIVVWDMGINLSHNKIKTRRFITDILAVGNKYIAIQAEVPVTKKEIFIIIDRVTMEEKTACELPSDLQAIGADGYPPVIVSDESWLDGLNEENAQDILCLCVCKRQNINVFIKLEENSPERNEKESPGYCNLL